jgi:hypothetical protein
VLPNPYVQIEGGFLAGLAEGFVPFGGVGHQLLDMGEVIPHGSPQARFGLAFGQVLGGIVTLLGGITGEVLGGIATTTGIGAAVGVPTIVVSTSFVIGGLANIGAGLLGLPQAMMSQGSGSAPKAAPTPAAGGKTYQTYTKTNPTTGEVYTGRTSGTGTPAQNLARRDAGHHMTNKGFGPAELDKSSSSSGAIRGREQQLIDINGGAKSTGGTSDNAINAISPNNPKGSSYLKSAKKEFGP